MKFTDLPLNVPVVVKFITEYPAVRLSATEFMILDTAYPHTDLGSYFYWDTIDIVDQPTDEDALELTISHSSIIKTQQAAVGIGAPPLTGYCEYDAYCLNVPFPGSILCGAHQHAYVIREERADERNNKVCSCPLYGSTGLLAMGCKCGGK